MFNVKQLELKKNEERQQFLELMEMGLTPKSLGWLEWKFLDNIWQKDGKPLVFGAVNEATQHLLGMVSFIPCRLVAGNKIFNAVQPCDSVVHPNCRGQKMFSAMFGEAISYLKENGFQLIFSFPNSNTTPITLKWGWEEVMLVNESFCFNNFRKVVKSKTNSSLYACGAFCISLNMTRASKTIKLLNTKNDKDLVINKENDFTGEFETLWQRVENNRIRMERKVDYLRWRFTQRPDKNYEIWTARKKGELDTYLISGTSHRWGSKEGQIVDFQYKDTDSFLPLLKTVMENLLKQQCQYVSIWAFTEKHLIEELGKIGFMHRSTFPFKYFIPQRKLIVNALDTGMREYFGQPQNWSLRACDQDTY